MAFELNDTGVSVVSLWPGMVQTELLGAGIRSGQASAGFHMPQVRCGNKKSFRSVNPSID